MGLSPDAKTQKSAPYFQGYRHHIPEEAAQIIEAALLKDIRELAAELSPHIKDAVEEFKVANSKAGQSLVAASRNANNLTEKFLVNESEAIAELHKAFSEGVLASLVPSDPVVLQRIAEKALTAIRQESVEAARDNRVEAHTRDASTDKLQAIVDKLLDVEGSQIVALADKIRSQVMMTGARACKVGEIDKLERLDIINAVVNLSKHEVEISLDRFFPNLTSTRLDYVGLYREMQGMLG